MSGTKPKSGATAPTPVLWLWGEWVILAEDRAAQQRGEPYWTLKEDSAGCCLARGPAGRKALEPEEIISACGYETDGIDATSEHRALIVRAVNCHADLVAALEEFDAAFGAFHSEMYDRHSTAYRNACNRLAAAVKGARAALAKAGETE